MIERGREKLRKEGGKEKEEIKEDGKMGTIEKDEVKMKRGREKDGGEREERKV